MANSTTTNNSITKILLPEAEDYNCSSRTNIWERRLLKNYKFRILHNQQQNNKDLRNWSTIGNSRKIDKMIWMTLMKSKISMFNLSSNNFSSNNQLLTQSKKKTHNNLYKSSRPWVKRRKRRRKSQKIISKYNKSKMKKHYSNRCSWRGNSKS